MKPCSDRENLLGNNPLNTITARLQRLHPGTIREPHKVVTRRVKQITPPGGVQVEEDTRNHNDLLLQTGLEEVQAIANRAGQALKVQPQVEGRVGHLLDVEAHLAQTVDDVVALRPKVRLQRGHLGAHELRLKHRHGGLLEGRVGAAVQVGAAAADRLDELFGADDPGDAPAGKAEALGQAIDDEDVVLIDILDVFLFCTVLAAACMG